MVAVLTIEMVMLAGLLLVVSAMSTDSIQIRNFHLNPTTIDSRILRLRGGESCNLVVPDDFPTMDRAMKFIGSEQVISLDF